MADSVGASVWWQRFIAVVERLTDNAGPKRETGGVGLVGVDLSRSGGMTARREVGHNSRLCRAYR